MRVVWADTETKSEADLRVVGAHRYAEHPSTAIQLFSYAFDLGPVKLWSPEDGEQMPDDLREAFQDSECVFFFHNSFFDRNIIENCLGIKLPLNRYRCVMAQALSHGLPGALDKLGEALGLAEDKRKHAAGKKLVQLFCKPKKQKDGSLKWATPQTHPEQWVQYKAYCVQDTATMRDVAKRIPRWNYPYQPTELDLWIADQTCNSRGMAIDLELVDAAMTAIEQEQTSLALRTRRMTEDAVKAASQRDALLKFISTQFGYDLADLQKANVEKIVEDEDYPVELRELLQVRLDTCTTSTSKYKKMKAVVSTDGRIRGTIQFAGASRTLRDGGRMIQPQNLAKESIPYRHILDGIEALKVGVADLLGFPIMPLTSSAIRYAIVASLGKKFCIADLSNIEGRVLAWLAGEEWKLDAFRAFDAGNGPDIYKASYAKAYNIEPKDVDKAMRTVGKVMELALGFQGGASAFVSFALIYRLDLDKLAADALPTLPKDILLEAESFYDWLNGMDIKEAQAKALKADAGIENWKSFYEAKSTRFMPKHQYVVFDALKRLWRQGHPKTVNLWKDTEDAVRSAIAIPNQDFWFGNGLRARRSGVWVRLILPSGHNLCYPQMQVDKNGKLRFKGVDQFTKKWQWIYTHGGRLVENLTQAFARDIFKHGQLNAEAEGYEIVLPVHDELVAEVPDIPFYSVHRLEQIMASPPPWAPDIPLAAEGFEDYRYHKPHDD